MSERSEFPQNPLCNSHSKELLGTLGAEAADARDHRSGFSSADGAEAADARDHRSGFSLVAAAHFILHRIHSADMRCIRRFS